MVNWAGAADSILLLCVLDQLSGKLDYEDIAKKVGQDCTPSAVKEHIKTLRKRARKDAGIGASPSKASPKKRKKFEEYDEDDGANEEGED